MKRVRVSVKVTRFQCKICRKLKETKEDADICASRDPMIRQLKRSVSSHVVWVIEDGYTQEGQVESIAKNKKDHLFVTTDEGERLLVNFWSIRELNGEDFILP